MTINEKNIVERWKMMASKDLGVDRNLEAFGFYELFRAVFEEEQTQVHTSCYINKIIREFAFNNDMEDECSITECFDLSHTDITKYAASQLDWYLMHRLGWFERYLYAFTQ